MKESLIVDNEIEFKASVPYWLLFRLSIVGFLVNCQPSEPFLTRYLIQDKDVTEGQLDDLVWPVDTYASLLFLLFMGFLAELVSYRAVIMVGLACRQITRLLLLFSTGLMPMQLMQATYAAATAAETVYFAYPYAVVDQELFLISTITVRASAHIGNAIGSGLGQILVSVFHVELRTLFFFSWGFTTLGVCAFTLLPYPKSNRLIDQSFTQLWVKNGPSAVLSDVSSIYHDAGQRVKRSAFASPLAIWSVWWVMGTVTSQIFINYQQNFVYVSDAHAPFGLIEVIMELGQAVIICFPLISHTHGHSDSDTNSDTFSIKSSASSVMITSAMWASVCFFSISLWGWPPPLWVTCLASVLLSALLGLQQAVASLSMANSAHSPDSDKEPRYAMVFSLTSLIGLILVATGQWIASQNNVKTLGYMLLAGAHEAIVIPLIVFFLLLDWYLVNKKANKNYTNMYDEDLKNDDVIVIE
mmetsp:Transcript_15014/g.19473  ORF Transcript_15014/g.19473 Transcript_15014/m.19473 type:complete len:471 (+) Transcript_15014:126-1538(+)